MSSYNSRSDSFPEPNEPALEAMLRSAQERLSINRSRLYLAGFSGTARSVLRFAVALRGHVAGVIAAGGALGFELGGPETLFAKDSTFAYFGAAGTADFNYEEVLAMTERFGTMGVPYRLATFEGPHSWPPPAICAEAVEWLELRAMRSGRRAPDPAWIERRLRSDVARAAQLEKLGQLNQALRLYEAVTRDYPPSRETRGATERADVLRNSAAVRSHRSLAGRLAEEDRRQAGGLQKTLKWARSSAAPPAPETLAQKLKLAKLKETASRGDSLRAASAGRLLERIFVWLAFYEPRTYIANDAPERALIMFDVATRIGPIRGESCALLRAALRAAPGETRFQDQCRSGSPGSREKLRDTSEVPG